MFVFMAYFSTEEADTNCDWTELVSQEDLPKATKVTKDYSCPLTSYLGKEISIAFRLNPLDNSATMPVIHIKGLQHNLEFNNGKSTTINAKNFEFSALNVTYNLDDLSKNNSHLNKLKEALGNKNKEYYHPLWCMLSCLHIQHFSFLQV